MSNPINTGGSAFPQPPTKYWAGKTEVESFQDPGGMTLRDWFAGQAITGILAADAHGVAPWEYHNDPMPAACIAYRVADAMLAAREGKESV